MKLEEVKEYINERNELTSMIITNVMKAISYKIKELPDGALDELGDVVFTASSDIAGTILTILAEDEGEEEYYHDF